MLLVIVLLQTRREPKPIEAADIVVIRAFDKEITAAQYSRFFYREITALNSLENVKTDLAPFRDKVVYELLKKIIILNWAETQGQLPSQDDISAELKEIQKGYPSTSDFQEVLLKQELDMSEFLEHLSYQVIQRKLIEDLKKDIQITKDQMQEFYKNEKKKEPVSYVRLHHVLSTTKAEASLILKNILKGQKSFAYYARKFSISPEGKQGGIINWIEVPEEGPFVNANKNAIGAVVGPVESTYGYHIYKVLGKKVIKATSFKARAKDIKEILTDRALNKTFEAWLQREFHRAKVYVDLDTLEQLKIHVN